MQSGCPCCLGFKLTFHFVLLKKDTLNKMVETHIFNTRRFWFYHGGVVLPSPPAQNVLFQGALGTILEKMFYTSTGILEIL